MSETESNSLTPENGWVLIKRGLYWRPNAQGYTGILAQAGLYSDEDSASRARPDEGVTRMPFREAAEVAKATFDDIAADYWREETMRLREALELQNEWVRGALQCKDWHWDGDQRAAAEWSLAQAEDMLSHDLARRARNPA